MKNLIIGLGHKARQGKDLIAQYWLNTRKNLYVIHFADELYNELRYSKKTLIYRDKNNYYLYDKNQNEYISKSYEEVHRLHEIFENRKISKYKKMIEKDPEILQFWGTDFRRKQNENYWIEKAFLKIELDSEDKIFVIPDLRFKNEFDAIKNNNGYCINVKRIDENNKQFIDKNRPHDHISETDLDNAEFDFVIESLSSNFNELYNQSELLLSLIINTNRK